MIWEGHEAQDMRAMRDRLVRAESERDAALARVKELEEALEIDTASYLENALADSEATVKKLASCLERYAEQDVHPAIDDDASALLASDEVAQVRGEGT